MKLLNADGCQPLSAGGNVNRLTKLVEVQGMGLRTRVRLPSGPLEKSLGNTVFSRLFILDKVKNEYFSISENFNSNVLLFKR